MDINLEGGSDRARESASQARRLLTARIEADHDPQLFAAVLVEVDNEVRDDPEALARLLASLSTLGLAMLTIIGRELDMSTRDVLQSIAETWEREDLGF